MYQQSLVLGSVAMRTLLFAVAVLLTTPLWAADMLAIPAANQLAEAERNVQTVYGEQIKAATSLEARRSLALGMLRTASGEKDPATRYAILQEARRLAVSATDALLGYQITQSLATEFGYPPVNNLKSEEWIAKGDRLRADAKKEPNRRDALATKLLAVECYLRAYPNATGLNKEIVDKRVLELALDGRNRKMADLLLLIGTWDVQMPKDYRAKWTFYPDGTVSSTSGEKKGQWMLEPRYVKICWEKKDVWHSFYRPLSISNVSGDSVEGIGIVKAQKSLTADSNR
jgi:hypothetical protein